MKDAALEIADQLGTVPVKGNSTVPSRNSTSSTEPARRDKETKKLQPLTYLQPAHTLLEELGLSEATPLGVTTLKQDTHPKASYGDGSPSRSTPLRGSWWLTAVERSRKTKNQS